jgi:hypothetical protein
MPMGMNNYDIESKNSKLVEDLKSLPKVKAPENFELNLMTRIQNQNFGEIKEEKQRFSYFKFLAPSAVVVTAFIVFFIFFYPSQQRILNFQPQPVVSDSQGSVASLKTDVARNNPEIKKSVAFEQKSTSNSASQQSNSNIAKYPINRNRSVSLDDYISGESERSSNVQQGNVVNGGEDAPNFDGFFVRQKSDKETIEKYRSVIDSLKKAEMRADSIKKAQK